MKRLSNERILSILYSFFSIIVCCGNGKRDPIWPLITASGAIVNYDSDFVISDLTLEGVMYGENNTSLAIINGKIVKVNEKMGKYIVSSIEQDKVILTKSDKVFELKLKKEE
jgi:hypothetical protein